MDDPTKPDLSEPIQQSSARTLLQNWYDRITRVQLSHFTAAMRFGKRNPTWVAGNYFLDNRWNIGLR
jgi:hypothetical protein